MIRALKRFLVTLLVLASGVVLADYLSDDVRLTLKRAWWNARSRAVNWWNGAALAPDRASAVEPEVHVEADPEVRAFATQLARMQQAQQMLAESLAQISARAQQPARTVAEGKR